MDIFALATTLSTDRPIKPSVGISEIDPYTVKQTLHTKSHKENLLGLMWEWNNAFGEDETNFSVDLTGRYELRTCDSLFFGGWTYLYHERSPSRVAGL